VLENKIDDGKSSRAISLSRFDKDDSDQWHENNGYFPDDLPKVMLAVQKPFNTTHKSSRCRQLASAGFS
jgi:hypothetical protein